MTTLSDPTLGLLIDIADDAFTASQLKNLLMRSDLWQYGQGDPNKAPNKAEMLRSVFLGARPSRAG